MRRFLPFVLLLASLAFAHAADLTFYVGTYTGSSGSKGIYKCTLDWENGKFGEVQLAAEAINPSFLTITPDGKFLYAASDDKGGSAIAFRVEQDGNLTQLNQQVATKGGGGVAHIWYDSAAQNVLTASYGSGSIAAFQTKPDGSLTGRTAFEQFKGSGPNKDRQEKPHAHSIYTDNTNHHVYCCDLGTDKIWIFKAGKKGTLTANKPAFATVPPGSGPRHLAFSPDGKYVYVANEMGGTVTAFTHNSDTGALTQFQNISTLPPRLKFPGTITVGEIYCHPSGKWLYVTNRGYNSIAVYSIAENGKLTAIQNLPSPVNFPRGFGLDPRGKWLVIAGQNDNKISLLSVDQETGKLAPTRQVVEAGSPVCIVFAPASY